MEECSSHDRTFLTNSGIFVTFIKTHIYITQKDSTNLLKITKLKFNLQKCFGFSFKKTKKVTKQVSTQRNGKFDS